MAVCDRGGKVGVDDYVTMVEAELAHIVVTLLRNWP